MVRPVPSIAQFIALRELSGLSEPVRILAKAHRVPLAITTACVLTEPTSTPPVRKAPFFQLSLGSRQLYSFHLQNSCAMSASGISCLFDFCSPSPVRSTHERTFWEGASDFGAGPVLRGELRQPRRPPRRRRSLPRIQAPAEPIRIPLPGSVGE